MPVLIKGKVIRNIPEQVSQNMKEIKALKTELYEKEYTIEDMKIVGGHLIISTYGGEQIDAGAIKNIVSMSIDGSQHLIATYNDGTTQDLGAIFSGNVNISGDLAVSGDITGNSIIENMTGYTFAEHATDYDQFALDYAGIVKNGNKLTMVIAGTLTPTSIVSLRTMGKFTLPNDVASLIKKIGATDVVAYQNLDLFTDRDTSISVSAPVYRYNDTLDLCVIVSGLTVNQDYYFRNEITFLLSENLAE